MVVVGMPFRGLFGLMCPSDDGMRKRLWGGGGTYTLLSVMDMESSVMASLEISLSLALVAGAKA